MKIGSRPVVTVAMGRGGSKRIPRKNLQPFCGRPLVEWTLAQSCGARLVTHRLLVTDDEEIARLGEKWHHEIVWQSHEECEQGVVGGTIAAVRAYAYMEDRGITDGVGITLLPTAPLRRPGEMDDILRVYDRTDLGSFGANAPISHPGMLLDTKDGRCIPMISAVEDCWLLYTMLYGVGEIAPQQARWRPYNIADAMVLKAPGDRKVVNVTSTRAPGPYYRVEPWQAHDVDTWWEFWVAEVCMERMILRGRGIEVYSEPQQIVLAPSGGDDTPRVQAAIDALARAKGVG